MKRDMSRRFAYIETCLYWSGGITASQLGKVFGITRQNAQLSMDAYRQKYPNNMIYNPSTKRHETSHSFQTHCISQDPLRYLNYLRGNSLTNHFWEDEDWGYIAIEDVDALYRPYINKHNIQLVIEAIQSHKTLNLYYHSKLEGFENLTIAPHQVVYVNKRYHLRAFCYQKNKPIDLVLSRMLEVAFSTKQWVSNTEDHEWHDFIDLKFKPNPALPEKLKNTLLLDFRLDNDIHTIKVRKALSFYVKREMTQLDWNHKIPLWILLE